MKRYGWLVVGLLIGSLLDSSAFAARQIFTYNNRNLPSTYDPARVSDVYSRNVLTQVFEGLTVNNPEDFSPEPGVASRWTVSDDGLVYTFYLNEQAKWSNGKPITAQDFVFAWRRVLDPSIRSPYVSHLYKIKNGRLYHKGKLKDRNSLGVEAVSPQVLKVTLENPTPYFLQLTSFYTLFPLPQEHVVKSGKKWAHVDRLVSNGPYVVAGASGKGDERFVRLKRNPHYWNSARYPLEEVHVYGIQNADKALALYSKGRLDYTGETEIPVKRCSSLAVYEGF